MTPPIFVLDGVFFTVCCIVCYGRKNVRTVSAHFSLPYYTQSVVYLYTLCVYGYGAAFRRPVFCPAFLKAGKSREACCPDRGMLSMQWKAPERETGLFFSLVRKEPKVHQRSADLWTPGTVQIAGRNGVFTEMTGFRQVTNFAETAISHSIDGNDLNRCKLQA